MSAKTNKPTDIRDNRTGIALAPVLGKEMVEEAERCIPTPSFDTAPIDRIRLDMSANAEPVGTMPPPATVKGVARTAVQTLKGKDPAVFLDLIGERLAFERTGTRLYEALLSTFDAADVHPGGPTRAALEEMRDQELAHYAICVKAMQKLGADPTAVTPCADIAAVSSQGLVQALGDPRTTLTEGLKAILIAELADNDGWLVLADFAQRLGQDELAADFRKALAEEDEHLARVRTWMTRSLEGQLGLQAKPLPTHAPAGAPPPA